LVNSLYRENELLKITRKVEYALIALRHMQAKDPKGLTSAKEIAIHYRIPKQLLAKILQQMSRDNIVEAVQGPAGGYRIRANLGEISLKDFFSESFEFT
jgi:Rrf2 family protein